MNRAVRLVLMVAVGMGALAAATPRQARAQVIRRQENAFASPKRFALELRFGPYGPDVDAEFGGSKTPYRQYFGKKRPLMTQLELDYQIFNGFGSVGIGASVGYFRQKAKAPFEVAGQAPDFDIRSGDETQLSLYPTALVLVYRADQLWRMLGIPLVPYGKLGLNYTFWTIYDGNDQVARGESTGRSGRGRGGTRGWQGALGLSLVLDFIDRGSARELDSETGVNHTHVFFEWAKYSVSGLGQSNRLNVGDSTWVMGLMFEF